MATRFQRRNAAPILLDIPTFDEVGRSAYVDLTQSPIATEMAADEPDQEVLPVETAPAAAAPAASPGGPVPVPPTTISPEAYQERAMADIRRMEALAERQRQSARNPLNVAGSILGGVVGLPFALLENAIGGGQNDLSAPFRPNQNAQERYQAALSAIGQRRAEVETTIAGMRASQAQAINTALTSQADRMSDARERAAILARNAGMSSDPQGVYAAGIQDMLADPVLGPTARQMGLAGIPWSQDLAYRLSTSEDTVNRIDASRRLVPVTVTSGGVAAMIDPVTGQPVTVINQGEVTQPMFTPPPQPQPAEQPISDAEGGAVLERAMQAGEISEADAARVRASMGPNGATQFNNWLGTNNIRVVPNAAPTVPDTATPAPPPGFVLD